MTLPVNGSTWAGGWAQSGVEASRAREKAMERFVMADTPGVFMVADFTSEIGKPFSARAFDSRWRWSLGWTLRQAATGWSILCSPEHTHCGRRNRHEQAMPDDRRRPPRPWCPPRLARLGGRDLDRAGGEGRRGGGRLGADSLRRSPLHVRRARCAGPLHRRPGDGDRQERRPDNL